MRLLPASLALLAFSPAALIRAQQPSQVPLPQAALEPNAPQLPEDVPPLEGTEGLAGVISGLVSKWTGVNATERALERRHIHEGAWRITDRSYKVLVENEELSDEEETQRVWLILISGSNNPELDKLINHAYDQALNETHIAGDLPHVRWGRANYYHKVTYLTLKWLVFKAPITVVVKDRGATVWFFSPHALRPHPDVIREFLSEKWYESFPPWVAPWEKHGKYGHWVKRISWFIDATSEKSKVIPSWGWYLIMATLSSYTIQWLHSGDKKDVRAAQAAAQRKKAVDALTAKAKAAAAKEKEEEGSDKGKAPEKAKVSGVQAGGAAGVKKRK